MSAAGVYLVLRLRTFPTVIGMTMMSYAQRFLFASGRLAVNKPPILDPYAEAAVYTDPPQALTLTAIVISFDDGCTSAGARRLHRERGRLHRHA